MLSNLKRAFTAYTRTVVSFTSASFMGVLMYGLCVLAGVGIFLLYFMAISGFNKYAPEDPITIGVVIIIVFLLKLLTSGFNAALAQAYSDGFDGRNTKISDFYSKALRSAPSAFGIMIIRDIIWLMFLAPVIALYVFALKGVQYIEIIIAIYGIFITWLIHMLFTPALLTSALTNSGIFASLKQGFRILRSKHIYFAGAYILFAVSWLLNLIPIIQIGSIFVLFPITYATLITFIGRD
ncbi:hypothetical protein HY988_06165 [Candidatus Micrarchaeota archaeon]|nr:hypothetical protein [Candidatus Micrarchaeota archaeon]